MKKRLVERVAKKVSKQIITVKVETQALTFSTQGYNKQLHVKRVTLLSASFYILNLCVLLAFKTVIGELLFLKAFRGLI